MATRLYLSCIQSPLDPSYSASSEGWTNDRGTVVNKGSLGSPSAFNTGSFSTFGASPLTAGDFTKFAQFVSPPLQAQRISGSINGQLMCSQGNTTGETTLAISISIIDSAGALVAVLLSVTGPSITFELASTNTNRSFRDSSDSNILSLTAANCRDGDRILLRVGTRSISSATTGTIDFSPSTTMTSGDCPVDDTSTTGLAWLSFDMDIVFQQPFYSRSASVPVDGSSATNATATLTITPPISMRPGDLVLVLCQSRNSTTWSIGVTGGQTWNSETAFDRAASDNFCRAFWCIFNGTWSANPRFDTTSSTCTTAVMHVFKGKTIDGFWYQDVSQTDTDHAAAATITRTGVTTIVPSAVAAAAWFTSDDNVWGTLSGTGWSVMGPTQFRNTSGSDQSASFASIVKDTPGATGDVSNTEITLGNDACVSWIMAFRNVIPLNLNIPTMRPPSKLKG